jgi:hypothetical protein
MKSPRQRFEETLGNVRYNAEKFPLNDKTLLSLALTPLCECKNTGIVLKKVSPNYDHAATRGETSGGERREKTKIERSTRRE